MTRLLLRPVEDEQLLPAAAQLLASEYANWAVVDRVRSGKPDRTAVAGPPGPLATSEPDSPVIRDVIATGGPVLLDPIEDDEEFGRTASGAPILAAAGAGSLISVALPPGGASDSAPAHGVAGVLTLIRRADRRGFSVADAGLVSEIAAHISMVLDRRGLP